jgi:hypothetical protein
MNKDVKGLPVRKQRIALLKQKIHDEAYMNSAINKLAAELTVFLSR